MDTDSLSREVSNKLSYRLFGFVRIMMTKMKKLQSVESNTVLKILVENIESLWVHEGNKGLTNI
jgi:hypothetical protein